MAAARPLRYVDVAGTWEDRDGQVADWNGLDSPFSAFRKAHGLEPLVTDPRRLYEWSTDLDGVPGDGGHADWRAYGRGLANYFISPFTGCPTIPSSETNLFSHSHGVQPVIYACAEFGLKVNCLIDIAGPVRADMADLAREAKKNIGVWLHLYAGWRDCWQWMGELFDGHLGIVRQQPAATVNARVPGGHGTILRDPSLFHLWVDQAWFGFLEPPQAAQQETA